MACWPDCSASISASAARLAAAMREPEVGFGVHRLPRADRKFGAVALAGQHPEQSPLTPRWLIPLHRGEPPAQQVTGRGELRLPVHHGDGIAHQIVGDAPRPQLVLECPTGQPAPGVARFDPHAGVLRVVQQSDLLEPVEQALGHPLRHAPAGQVLTELCPGLGRGSELAQRDRPGDRHGVGVRGEVGRRSGSGRLGPSPGAPPWRSRHRYGQKSTGALAFALASVRTSTAGASTRGPIPSFSLIFFSNSLARSGLSRRKARAFSLPWPS